METRFKRYCICGASMTGTVSPAKNLQWLLSMWSQVHSGDGHAPCDAKTAAAARRRDDRASGSVRVGGGEGR